MYTYILVFILPIIFIYYCYYDDKKGEQIKFNDLIYEGNTALLTGEHDISLYPNIAKWVSLTGPWTEAKLIRLPANTKINKKAGLSEKLIHLGLIGSENCKMFVNGERHNPTIPGVMSVFDGTLSYRYENGEDEVIFFRGRK